jgi:hypothetical protein
MENEYKDHANPPVLVGLLWIPLDFDCSYLVR